MPVPLTTRRQSWRRRGRCWTRQPNSPHRLGRPLCPTFPQPGHARRDPVEIVVEPSSCFHEAQTQVGGEILSGVLNLASTQVQRCCAQRIGQRLGEFKRGGRDVQAQEHGVADEGSGGGAGLMISARWFTSLVRTTISAVSRPIREPMPNLRLLETSPRMSCNIPELRSEIAKSPAKLNAVMSANGVPSRSKLNAATSKINGIKSDGTMVPADVVIVTCVTASDWWAARVLLRLEICAPWTRFLIPRPRSVRQRSGFLAG